MLTLERTPDITQADAELRRRWPELAEPLVLPWSEMPVLALDRGTPWLYGPIERDPLATARGRTALPRGEIRRLRAVADRKPPFQRLAFAHELDLEGSVRGLLPLVRQGPRTCTDEIARAVVGPQPPHPGVRATVRALHDVFGRKAVDTIGAVLDPIVFGVVGLPAPMHGQPALFYPVAQWRW